MYVCVYVCLFVRMREYVYVCERKFQKEQQKVEMPTSNFDPIDGDLPGLLHPRSRRI